MSIERSDSQNSNIDDLLRNANAALAAGEEDKAIDLLKQASDQGDWRASASLGYIFESRGKLKRDNFVKAAHWYTRSLTQQENPDANLGLARYYYFGLNGTWDFNRAFEHLTRSQPEQNPEARLMMGELYLNGLGVREDPIEARRLFLSVAYLNYPAGHLGIWQLELRSKKLLRAIAALTRYFFTAIPLVLKDRNDNRLVGTGGKHGNYRRSGFILSHSTAEKEKQ